MKDDIPLLGRGFYWQDMKVGDRYRTFGRTITEPDLVNFISCTGMLEVLFTNEVYRQTESAIKGRLVPGALVFSMAEGLVIGATIQGTGMAFLGMELEIKGPTLAGDTIHVVVEVTEQRAASTGNRGLVRTKNSVIKQDGSIVMIYSPLRMMKGHPIS
ncbi:MAG: MaoC family dehydratase N-terminal domain-containing protein [Hyphomicrobiaceae bacterium]|nr:MaoC family dehydratase N-terminal domain-containing protein [Hyphomicrobiaceae bacterium]